MGAKQKGTKAKKKNCRYCKKEAHGFPNDGRSARDPDFMKSEKTNHPWELKGQTVRHFWQGDSINWHYKKTTIQPHHLIPISLMHQDTNWKRNPTETKVGLRNPSFGEVLMQFGYDINCKENGAFYPDRLELACHLAVPLHRGGHPPDTLDFAISAIMPIMKKIKTGKYCHNYDKLKTDLDKEVSKRICDAINSFSFHYPIKVKTTKIGTKPVEINGETKDKKAFKIDPKAQARKVASALTSDFRDYKPGSPVGCGNAESIREQKDHKCMDNRIHFLRKSLAKGQKSLPGGGIG